MKSFPHRSGGWGPIGAGAAIRDRAPGGPAAAIRAWAVAALVTGVVLLVLPGCGASGGAAGGLSSGAARSGGAASPGPSTSPAGTPSGRVPAPAHTVVVVMENHSYAEVIGNAAAPFINMLARRGALFTDSRAITHPSEPNYLALFSGSTQGVSDDSCPVEFTAPNLAADLLRAGKTFAGYSEGLPSAGSHACSAGEYARKHVPWADFRNVPGSVSQPFSGFPAADFARLPAVSFVIPNLCNDMHDCSVATGDSWLRTHIASYANWAMTHDSLLILTWDEDDGSASNQILTIFAGEAVQPGKYAEPVTHYSVLATIEAAYGLPRDGHAAGTAPITGIWQR